MKFSIYQESRKGARPNNQDRTGYSYSRDALLMVVADGMGGHLHGEVASHIAVQFLAEAFQREVQTKLADPFMFLLTNIGDAHHAIVDYAEARGLLETPRTTCVACVVQDSIAYWAHVGDSRLYHVRAGRIVAQTKDHSRVQWLIDQGRVREEAIAAHPDRNKIFNCLGAMTPPQVELSRKTVLQPRDILLLCTDGLWGPLSGRMIGAALATDDIMRAIPELLDTAELRAGCECDNLSTVAMTWADSYSGAAHQVSTLTLEPSSFATKIGDVGKPGTELADLSEAEIERSIAGIRNAIRRQTAK
jgi:serine/threonine protein phosphatase PrpC